MLSRSVLAVILATLFTTAHTFNFPDAVPLGKRQAPGTPQYDCHADCGGVITLSRTSNYCISSNFTSLLTDCLNCALQYDIWQYYGESVGAAATACNVTATPRAVNATSSVVVSTTDISGAASTSSAGSSGSLTASVPAGTAATGVPTGASASASTAASDAGRDSLVNVANVISMALLCYLFKLI